MGLDGVELIMAVEEAFDLEIRDEEAETLDTVGSIYALIVSKLALNQSRRCPSSVLFYQTRRELMERLGVPRRSVTPSTPMERLLPHSERKAHWRELRRVLRAPLPDLELSRSLRRPFSGLLLALLVSCLAAYRIYPTPMALSYTVACGFLAWLARQRMTELAVQIPAGCGTVSDTVRTVLRLNSGALPARRDWDPNEVWETLRRVVAEQLDVPLEAVTVDAHLVYDLGAD